MILRKKLFFVGQKLFFVIHCNLYQFNNVLEKCHKLPNHCGSKLSQGDKIFKNFNKNVYFIFRL